MDFHVKKLYQNLDFFQKSHRLKIFISNPFRKVPLSIFVIVRLRSTQIGVGLLRNDKGSPLENFQSCCNYRFD